MSSASAATPRARFISVRALSKATRGIDKTTSPNMSSRRRYASRQNLRSASDVVGAEQNLWTTSSFNPRLRTVSIMPGIETAAPERTERSSGSSLSLAALEVAPPRGNERRICFSMNLTPRSTSFQAPFSSSWAPPLPSLSASAYSAHRSVDRVNPAGTSRPTRLISARPAPLPPSCCFMVPSPSVSALEPNR